MCRERESGYGGGGGSASPLAGLVRSSLSSHNKLPHQRDGKIWIFEHFVTSKVTSLRHVGHVTFFDTAPVSHVNRLCRKRGRRRAGNKLNGMDSVLLKWT